MFMMTNGKITVAMMTDKKIVVAERSSLATILDFLRVLKLVLINMVLHA